MFGWVHVSSFKSNLSPSLVVVLVLTNNNLLSSLLAMASSSSPGTSCTDKSHGPESGWSSGYHKSYVIVDHGDHGDHHLGPHPPSQHHLVHPPVPPYLSSLHINTVLLLCMLYQCSHHPSLTWWDYWTASCDQGWAWLPTSPPWSPPGAEDGLSSHEKAGWLTTTQPLLTSP